MKTPPPTWHLSEYEAPDGTKPVLAFLEGLDKKHKAQAFALIQMLTERGGAMRPPQSKLVETGLFELRGHQVRIFFIFLSGHRIVLLDGIVKKQDEIPARDLKRIRAMRAEVEKQDKERKQDTG